MQRVINEKVYCNIIINIIDNNLQSSITIMEPIANSLQKSIQDNFKKLNIYGLANTPEVMCSCSVFNPTGSTNIPVSGSISNVVSKQNTIPSQFIPNVKNDGKLLHIDPGNAPFILPQGMTPDDIMIQQAAALAPLKEEAEKKAAAAAAATGRSTVVTETNPGGSTTIAFAIPATSSSTTISTPNTSTVIGGVTTPSIITSTPPPSTSSTISILPSSTSTSVPTPPNPNTIISAPLPTIPSTTTTLKIDPLVERYASFQYDLDEDVSSYRDSLVQQPPNLCHNKYVAGINDMLGVSLFSWCIYIVIIIVLYFILFLV